MSTQLKIPHNLSYAGSFSLTSAVMYGANQNGDIIAPVEIKTKTVRGTISHAKHATQLEKGEASNKTEDANIQRIDVAELPHGADHLLVDYKVKITPKAWTPWSCSNKDVREMLESYVDKFTEQGGMKTLARLYVKQMLSDEWLWRNNDALDIKVKATAKARKCDPIEVTYYPMDQDGDDLEPLIELVAEVLENKRRVVFIDIVGLVELTERAEVYPSQEFVDNKSRSGKEKSKTLFSIELPDGTRQAAMHSQKVGNALRKIDDWHGSGQRIAVEMFGIDQQRHASYRSPSSKKSFFDHLKNLPKLVTSLEGGVGSDHLYLTACLIRGGVVGQKDEEKAA